MELHGWAFKDSNKIRIIEGTECGGIAGGDDPSQVTAFHVGCPEECAPVEEKFDISGSVMTSDTEKIYIKKIEKVISTHSAGGYTKLHFSASIRGRLETGDIITLNRDQLWLMKISNGPFFRIL